MNTRLEPQIPSTCPPTLNNGPLSTSEALDREKLFVHHLHWFKCKWPPTQTSQAAKMAKKKSDGKSPGLCRWLMWQLCPVRGYSWSLGVAERRLGLIMAFSGIPRGVFRQRAHSANYYDVYPWDTSWKPPPYRSVHDPFRTASGVQNSGPWDPWLPVVENSRLSAQRARCTVHLLRLLRLVEVLEAP